MTSVTKTPSTTAVEGSLSRRQWYNDENIRVEDGNFCNSSGSYGAITMMLEARTLSFSVPYNAIITGVKVAIKKKQGSPTQLVRDYSIRLYTSLGFSTSLAKRDIWPDALTDVEYGGDGELWGLALTPAVINYNLFRVYIEAMFGGDGIGSSAYIDVVKVTVYYFISVNIESPVAEMSSEMLPAQITGEANVAGEVAECAIAGVSPTITGDSNIISATAIAELSAEEPTIDEGEVLSMTVNELITRLDREFSNSRSVADKVNYVNDLERDLYTKKIMALKSATKSIVADQKNYAVLPGFYVEDIELVEVSGIEYGKASLVSHDVLHYYNENDELCLDPIPEEDVADGLYIVYRSKPNLKTVAGVATETLALPYDFVELYLNYLKARICTDTKNYAEYSNWQQMYNESEREFLKWYMENAPRDQVYKNNKRWRWPS